MCVPGRTPLTSYVRAETSSDVEKASRTAQHLHDGKKARHAGSANRATVNVSEESGGGRREGRGDRERGRGVRRETQDIWMCLRTTREENRVRVRKKKKKKKPR